MKLKYIPLYFLNVCYCLLHLFIYKPNTLISNVIGIRFWPSEISSRCKYTCNDARHGNFWVGIYIH
jgi:hypothetical protein